jgi:hypothetical protein
MEGVVHQNRRIIVGYFFSTSVGKSVAVVG